MNLIVRKPGEWLIKRPNISTLMHLISVVKPFVFSLAHMKRKEFGGKLLDKTFASTDNRTS